MLMRDQDLCDAISSGRFRIDYLPALTAQSWYAKDSPVQPASLDLRIGKIYLPGVGADELGSTQKPLREWSLRTGHTAVVVTREILHLPSDLAAIGFPPASVSSRGLL
jgi:deoxycytidine triphosphate deaminase